MKLFKLSAPRSVVVHNDDAFESPFEKPGPVPDDGDQEALGLHERAAVRWEAWNRWQASYDFSELERFLRPGRRPVVFKVRALPPDAGAALMDLPREFGKRCILAVRYGVTDILNLKTVDEMGAEGIHKAKLVDGEFGPALDETSMSLFAADPELLVEVAMHVLAASQLPKGLHKSG